ncbi:hypothetical protein FDT66_05910 [Polaribacter aestuariivivens]|uniref:Uncharacterized protein n=1 Tax=Polaribacter aestuariivivens TaxID=2304626 RepID=A0A5S3N816_9FLAO|nr:hypothetical protein [Polaribacter aestuariivivens]TMM31495.1 hypothetical protein FDT66_05910 [Polaribacter aestuariivivens]
MNFINKINKYLLENYPLIWNTRLAWMLVANIFIHLLFFIIGYSSANTIGDLKEFRSLESFFFETSAVYYNFLISIFILLIWIIYYLRNNAFKSLYAFKKWMLFKQFCIIFIILFISGTQYFSFKKGLRTKIKSLYSWQEVNNDIKTFNNISLFFIQNQRDYEIDKKAYPKPFPLKVANNFNKSTDNIDETKPYIEFNNSKFQFYEINEKLWQEDLKQNEFLNIYAKNSFKYRIVKDVSEFKIFLNPSLYNYAATKFTIGQDSTDYKKQLIYFKNILDSQNDFQIKEDLKKGISLANKYELNHNLTVDNWFQLLNNRPNYLLKELINTSNPIIDNYNEFDNNNSRFSDEIPYSKTLYLNFSNLDNLFSNIYFSYHPTFNNLIFNFLLTLALFLSILLFIFKTTDIKTILLSVVASLVVLVVIVWLMSSSKSFLEGENIRNYREFLIMMFISFTIIILSIISYTKHWKKLFIQIIWTLGIFAFPLFFLFSGFAYSKYLDLSHKKIYPKDYDYVSGFEKWFNAFGFSTVILIWLITVCIYSIYIRKLKARPE